MFCQFNTEAVETGYRHTCQTCGAVVVTAKENCSRLCGKAKTVPALHQRMATVTTEYAKWVAAGSPVRSPAEKEMIFQICQSCAHYKKVRDDAGECQICGCGVKRSEEWLNKIHMATTTCPINLWGTSEKTRWYWDGVDWVVQIAGKSTQKPSREGDYLGQMVDS